MTDLTDRMRTCAAWIIGDRVSDVALKDAADLLIEASNALEAIPQPLGAPMEILEAKPLPTGDERKAARVEAIEKLTGTWIDPGGALPVPVLPMQRNKRACPQCDSRANKKVYREGNMLMLVCPVCAHVWAWKR